MEESRNGLSDELVFDMEMKEDVETELEEFIALSRLGIFYEAREIAQNVLWQHLNIFPVMAEIAGFLVEHKHLAMLTRLLEDLDTRGIKYNKDEEQDFVASLRQITNQDLKTRSTKECMLVRMQNFMKGELAATGVNVTDFSCPEKNTS